MQGEEEHTGPGRAGVAQAMGDLHGEGDAARDPRIHGLAPLGGQRHLGVDARAISGRAQRIQEQE